MLLLLLQVSCLLWVSNRELRITLILALALLELVLWGPAQWEVERWAPLVFPALLLLTVLWVRLRAKRGRGADG